MGGLPQVHVPRLQAPHNEILTKRFEALTTLNLAQAAEAHGDR